MEFRALRREDDRSKFCCGSEEIDRFFRNFAGQNQFKHQIGVSYVLAEGDRVAAFVTVASGSLSLPAALRRRMPSHPLPVLLIARLGVDREFQGQKLANRLLTECCALAVQQALVVGCCGLVIDSKPEVIELYRRFGFQPIADPNEEGIQRHFLGSRRFKDRGEAPDRP